jgi:radical SAM protein with 4Fe4S-binding SPASM domain
MDEHILNKILNDLAAINYTGSIKFGFFCEPLLDPYLEGRVTQIKTVLFRSKIIVLTNGDLLTIERYVALSASGVDLFVVSQHDPEVAGSLRELSIYLKERRNRKAAVICQKIKETTLLYNRGALVAPQNVNHHPRCLLIDSPLIIDYAGNVLLCCNDYFGEHAFGNVATSNIIDIWNNDDFRRIRTSIRHKNYPLAICRKCVGKRADGIPM